MEIAFLVIAVIGLLALTQSGGGQVQGNLQYTPNQPYEPPQPWSPSPAGSFNVPMVPSQSANIDGALLQGGAQIGTTVAQQAVKSSGGALGMSAATAVPVIGAAIGAAVAIGAALLAAHKARLQGATNENQAVDQYVPVFDSFVKQVTDAYNAKQIPASQCAQLCQQFDQAIYQAFRGFVGHPGTAWSDTNGMAGKCDKTCTVGCCVYFGDLGPVLNNISYVLGFPTSKWGKGDPRISGRTVTVPKVYPSKYSAYTRPLYTITLK
jgi:hypothetical protein